MRIVIKVGTSTLTHPSGHMDIRHVEKLVKVISDLKNAGNEIILVSSGAIGMGVGKLNLKDRPKDIPGKQAAASVGQCELMYIYDRYFSQYSHVVSQILLTGPDFEDPLRKENFQNTMDRLLLYGVIPVINENDTIATDEIKVGDNDTLGALVAINIKADLLILLSDIDGLFTGDPRKNSDARLISEISEINDEILSLAGGTGSGLATGGMLTKLKAADLVMKAGSDMVILNGKNPDLLYDLLDGKSVGTRFRHY